jgi:hypothetical protein
VNAFPGACLFPSSLHHQRQSYGGKEGAMPLDPNEFLKIALIVIVGGVLLVIVLPYLMGGGRGRR